MTVYFAEEGALLKFLKTAGRGRTYAAVRREVGCEYAEVRPESEEQLSLREARPSASPKRFFTPPCERVASYSVSGADKPPPAADAEAPRTLVGLRACDLAAAQYLDKVFLEGEFQEPGYAARRKTQIVISVDCTSIHKNCFCDVVGGRPFAMGGFDLNISPLAKGYVVWVGSERGQALVDAHKGLFREARPEELEEVKRQRQKTSEELQKQNQGLKLTDHLLGLLGKLEDSDEWRKHAARCVECAACTNICPTCHCFYLYDRAAGKGRFERIKTWDSCLTADYSRMAGVGGVKPNPRPRLRTRFANRFMHKYSYSPQQYGLLGCTGCGRCMEACFGAVDIRKVLKEIEQSESVGAKSKEERG